MEIRQLEYFVMVAAFQNFTHASRALHVSQPSVTKAIQALEAELSLALIDRAQKRVTLTAGGEAFLGCARRVLDDMEDARQTMASFSGRQEIRLAYPEVLAMLFTKLAKKLEGFMLKPLPCGGNEEAKIHVATGEAHFALLLGESMGGIKLFSLEVAPCFEADGERFDVCLYYDQSGKDSSVSQAFLQEIDRLLEKGQG